MRLLLATLLTLTSLACDSASDQDTRSPQGEASRTAPSTSDTVSGPPPTRPTIPTTVPGVALTSSDAHLFSFELVSVRGATREVISRPKIITRTDRPFGVETQQTIAPYGQVDVSWSFTTQALEADAGIELSATITVTREGEVVETHETTSQARWEGEAFHHTINLAGDHDLEFHAVITAAEPE